MNSRSRSPSRVKQWDTRFTAIQAVSGIPEYDATRDRHCPLTKSKTFRKRFEQVQSYILSERLPHALSKRSIAYSSDAPVGSSIQAKLPQLSSGNSSTASTLSSSKASLAMLRDASPLRIGSAPLNRTPPMIPSAPNPRHSAGKRAPIRLAPARALVDSWSTGYAQLQETIASTSVVSSSLPPTRRPSAEGMQRPSIERLAALPSRPSITLQQSPDSAIAGNGSADSSLYESVFDRDNYEGDSDRPIQSPEETSTDQLFADAMRDPAVIQTLKMDNTAEDSSHVMDFPEPLPVPLENKSTGVGQASVASPQSQTGADGKARGANELDGEDEYNDEDFEADVEEDEETHAAYGLTNVYLSGTPWHQSVSAFWW
eukprot:CAMPEP_0184667008 /NCGR_PEP_ID=MMETSP0308-20130426/65002_1 /TAXON_ID=38269 /ORGANISM="Gloeochaete witrockiana, Strain SAG 46.84" /LENGTH=371 /DNA_ID=CAMNT_0027111947 /DNA_START=146 /DNA_END=1259 /DNA_ORIENTATION=+